MIKLNTPPVYNGDSAANVETWLFQVEQHLVAAGVNDDRQRIAVASGYLGKLAAQWWRSRVEVRRDAPVEWNAFKAAVRERFEPVAASQTARAELYGLSQGNNSVAHYQEHFFKLIQLINDMSETDQVERFVLGLKPSIAIDVDRLAPQTLQQAMIEATKAETRYKNFRRRQFGYPVGSSSTSRSLGYYRSPYLAYPSVPGSSSNSSTSTAMELSNLNVSTASGSDLDLDDPLLRAEYDQFIEAGVNNCEPSDEWKDSMNAAQDEERELDQEQQLHAMQQRPQRRAQHHAPPMSREEFSRLMKAGLCLRCKKSGHIARNCPLPSREHSSTNTGRNFQ